MDLQGYTVLNEFPADPGTRLFSCIENSNKTPYAVKEIDLDSRNLDLDTISREVNFLKSCRSPNILRCNGAHMNTDSLTLYIVLEPFVASLQHLLHQDDKRTRKLSERSVAYILHEVLLALVYLHSEHKVHRDVRGANIFLNAEGNVKLSEFGLASKAGAQKCQTYVGSPLWMAPEVIRHSPDLINDDATLGYDEAADIWSLGITAIEIATGSVPRSNVPTMRLLFSIIAEPAPVLQGSFSDEFKDFVSQCLQKDPQSRSSAIDLLIHPFVANAKITDEIYQWIEQVTFSDMHPATESHSVPDQVPTDHASVDAVQDIAPKSKCIERKPFTNTWAQLASMASTLPCASDLSVLLQLRASQHDGQHEDIIAPLGKFMMERYNMA